MLIQNMVESNGRTVRQNNSQIAHRIPLGTLVRVLPFSEGTPNGMVGFVAEHSRDCDGTPLYSLTLRPASVGHPGTSHYHLLISFSEAQNPLHTALAKHLCVIAQASCSDGYCEDNLEKVREPTENEREEFFSSNFHKEGVYLERGPWKVGIPPTPDVTVQVATPNGISRGKFKDGVWDVNGAAVLQVFGWREL